MGERTPPNSTNPEAVATKSTPFSKGTASVAEFNDNLKAKAPHNITNLAEDLKKKKTTTIIPFLRTLISRILLERKRNEPGRASGNVELVEHRQISELGEDIFNQILALAVDFCNSEKVLTTKMKKELRYYCDTAIEKGRHLHLSNALNIILMAFRKNRLGDIPAPDSHEQKEEIIFTPLATEPQTLKGKHQDEDTKCTPDMCAVFLSRLCQTDDTRQDFSFEAMATEIANGRRNDEEKIEWIDVQQSWELKRSKSKLEYIEKIWNVDEIIRENPSSSPHPTQSTPPPPPPQPTHPPPRQGPKKQNSRKRPLDDKSKHSSKRSRTSGNPRQSLLGSTAKGKGESDGERKGSNQYARYALERSSAEWYVTCSSVVLLDDTSLSLHWFDAQGCLESKPFHIFEQLPLFVSMVVILQRFTPQNWGLSQRDKNKVTVSGREFLLEHNEEPLYQLHGRRTYVAFANDPPVTPVIEDIRLRPPQGIPADRIPRHRYSTRNKATAPATGGEAEGTLPAPNTEPHGDPPVAEPAATSATEDKAPANADGQSPPPESTFPYCFKQADVEGKRDPEFVIAEKARTRAKDFLPEEYRDMVVKHLPDIVVGEKREDLTTADIRLHAKLAGGLPDVSEEEIMDQARVRILMVSRTLKSVLELSPSQFWEVFWDIMRCLYLLWRIGIAHGDISLANMMYKEVEGKLKGILNDFDLAAVMEIGKRSPEKKGWERTGTLPFMALDLLRFYDGQIKRWFRHDLESGAWCLAWQMLYKESEHREWYTGTFKSIYNHKGMLLRSIDVRMVKEDWQDYFDFIDNWLSQWSELNIEMDARTKRIKSLTEVFKEREKYNEEHLDEEFIRTAEDLARKYGLDNVDALKDTSWIGVQLLPDPLQPK